MWRPSAFERCGSPHDRLGLGGAGGGGRGRGTRRSCRRGRSCQRVSERRASHHGDRWVRHCADVQHASVVRGPGTIGDLRLACGRGRMDGGARLFATDRRTPARTCARSQGARAGTPASRRSRLLSIRKPPPRVLDRVHGRLLVRGRGDERARGGARVRANRGGQTSRLLTSRCPDGRQGSPTL